MCNRNINILTLFIRSTFQTPNTAEKRRTGSNEYGQINVELMSKNTMMLNQVTSKLMVVLLDPSTSGALRAPLGRMTRSGLSFLFPPSFTSFRALG